MKKIFFLGFMFIILASGIVTAALLDGLVAYWSFDDEDTTSTTIIDIHQGLYNGTRGTNNPINVSGRVFEARNFTGAAGASGKRFYDLNGTGTQYRFNRTALNSNSVTQCAWIRRNSATNQWQHIFSGSTGQNFVMQLRLTSNQVQIETGGNTLIGRFNLSTVGKWYYVCKVFKNADSHTLYINGTLDKNVSVATGIGNFNNIAIGKQGSGTPSNYFNGSIDEIGVWNRTLSGTEILELYNNGSGLPYENFSATSPVLDSKQLVSQTQNSTAPETSVQFFNIIASFNNTKYGNATGLLYWNSTEFTAQNISRITAGDITNVTLRAQVHLPLITINASTVGVWWNVTFINITAGQPNATLSTVNVTQNLTFAYLSSLFSERVLETNDIEINLTINKIVNNAIIRPLINFTNQFFNPIILINTSTSEVWRRINATNLNSNSSAHNRTTETIARIELFDLNTSTSLNRTVKINTTIYNLNLRNTCSAGTYLQNFTYRDIDDNSPINATTSFIYQIFVNRTRGQRNISFGLNSSQSNNICTNANLPTGLIFFNDLDLSANIIGYGSVGFFQRNNTLRTYYLQNITLFAQDNTENITIEVVDENENALRNHIVIAERFIPTTNSYTQVDSDTTDINGKVRLELVTGNNEYRFIIKNPMGVTLLTSVKFKILESSYRFRVTLVQFDVLINLMNFQNLPHNLTYNNDTKIVNFNWSDNLGISNGICLKVQQINTSGSTILFQQCDYSNSTGVITYNLITSLNGSFQAIAYGYAASSNQLFNIDILDIIDEIEQPFRNLGLLLGFFMILLMGGIAMTGNPAVLIIVTSLGLIFAVMTQMWVVGFSVVAGLIFIGILAAFRSRV